MNASGQSLEKDSNSSRSPESGARLPHALGATRVSAIQEALPPPCSLLTRTDPSPPGEPWENSEDDPYAGVGVKLQLSSMGGGAKEGFGKNFHHLCKL